MKNYMVLKQEVYLELAMEKKDILLLVHVTIQQLLLMVTPLLTEMFMEEEILEQLA